MTRVVKERERLQEEALHCYKQAARNRNFPISEIAAHFREAHFYLGVVKLAFWRVHLVEKGGPFFLFM